MLRLTILPFQRHVQASKTMSRQLDNVNPTIFAPSAPSFVRRSTGKSAKSSLWAPEALSDDGEDYYSPGARSSGSVSDEEEGREDIDAQEVYGGLLYCMVLRNEWHIPLATVSKSFCHHD